MQTTTPKTDRFHRAPRGGCVCPLSGRYFRGGQFLPLATAEEMARLAKPVGLTGSTRQISWAERLRKEALARLNDEIHARTLFMASPIRAEVAASRKAVKPLLIARHGLMTETSAARIIERRGMI